MGHGRPREVSTLARVSPDTTLHLREFLFYLYFFYLGILFLIKPFISIFQVQESDDGVLQRRDGFSVALRSDQRAELPQRQELDV